MIFPRFSRIFKPNPSIHGSKAPGTATAPARLQSAVTVPRRARRAAGICVQRCAGGVPCGNAGGFAKNP